MVGIKNKNGIPQHLQHDESLWFFSFGSLRGDLSWISKNNYETGYKRFPLSKCECSKSFLWFHSHLGYFTHQRNVNFWSLFSPFTFQFSFTKKTNPRRDLTWWMSHIHFGYSGEIAEFRGFGWMLLVKMVLCNLKTDGEIIIRFYPFFLYLYCCPLLNALTKGHWNILCRCQNAIF